MELAQLKKEEAKVESQVENQDGSQVESQDGSQIGKPKMEIELELLEMERCEVENPTIIRERAINWEFIWEDYDAINDYQQVQDIQAPYVCVVKKTRSSGPYLHGLIHFSYQKERTCVQKLFPDATWFPVLGTLQNKFVEVTDGHSFWYKGNRPGQSMYNHKRKNDYMSLSDAIECAKQGKFQEIPLAYRMKYMTRLMDIHISHNEDALFVTNDSEDEPLELECNDNFTERKRFKTQLKVCRELFRKGLKEDVSQSL